MSKTNMIHKTAYHCDGTPIRLKLDPEAAIEIDDRNWSTGLTMKRVWFGKNRIITEAYSYWQNSNGYAIGTVFNIITDKDGILQFCDKAEIDPPSWIEEEA